MLNGETVTLLTPRRGSDAYGREESGFEEAEVDNVLWYQSLSANGTDDDAALSAGDSSELWLHWPRAHRGSLAGCRVRLSDGSEWDVVGDPHGHMGALCPGPWDRNVKAVRRTAAAV